MSNENQGFERVFVKQTQPKLKGLVLMTPYYLEPNKDDAMRKMMDVYGAIVKKIAVKYNTVFVDTQAAFDKALKHRHSAEIAWDRVHHGLSLCMETSDHMHIYWPAAICNGIFKIISLASGLVACTSAPQTCIRISELAFLPSTGWF